MGDWQRGELSGADVSYLIAMQNGAPQIGGDAPPSVEALNAWQQELNFEATHLLLDTNWTVINRYLDANPQANPSPPNPPQALTAIFDKKMKIRRVGGTYDTNHNTNLTVIQDLLNE